MKMKALVIHHPKKASIELVDYPEPKDGEVTIKVERTGICGTDFHIFEGEFISPYPIIPGHEFSGTIHKIGPNVGDRFKIGDRVTADPSLFCGSCKYCLTKRGNHCENWGALGNTVNGSMAEYVSVPAKNVVHIPDHLSFEEAAFVEPVACVVHGINRLQLDAGDRVILFGAGAMGQQLIQALVHSGASELAVVDVSPQKLAMARDFGATTTVLANELDDVKQSLGTFDAVVDVTGIPEVIEKSFAFMGPTGKFLQFGVTPTNASISINPFEVYHKDWTILGSMAINHTFIPALHWVATGRINVQPLLSKQISLEEAVSFLAQPKDADLLKVQVAIGG